MQIRTFWTLLLKLLGLWLLLSCVYILPQFFSLFYYINEDLDMKDLLPLLGIIVLTITIFYLIIKLFLFKTDWLIDKLKLDQNFTEERIDLNIKSATVLRIAVIIVGGLIFVDTLPSLCQQLFQFFNQKMLLREYPETGWLIFNFVKALIGYLLMTNSHLVMKYILKNAAEQD